MWKACRYSTNRVHTFVDSRHATQMSWDSYHAAWVRYPVPIALSKPESALWKNKLIRVTIIFQTATERHSTSLSFSIPRTPHKNLTSVCNILTVFQVDIRGMSPLSCFTDKTQFSQFPLGFFSGWNEAGKAFIWDQAHLIWDEETFCTYGMCIQLAGIKSEYTFARNKLIIGISTRTILNGNIFHDFLLL